MRPPRGTTRFWQVCSGLTLLVALLLLPSALFAQGMVGVGRDTASYEVSRVRFEGNQAIGDKELHTLIATEPTRCKSVVLYPLCRFTRSSLVATRHDINRPELGRDVLRIRVRYWLRGYRDAAVDTLVRRSNRGDAGITFSIAEGDPFLIGALNMVHPPEPLDGERIARLIEVRSGDPLDLIRLDSARTRVRDALLEAGYPDALVTIDTTRTGPTMDVTLRIDPGKAAYISQIQVTGNAKVGTRTILNSLYTSPGDRYRLSEIVRSQRALYESALFRRATIDAVRITDSTRMLLVDVSEAPLRQSRLGIGMNTVDFFQLDGQFTNYNWRGGARRVTLSATVGNLLAPQLNGKSIFRDVLEGVDTRGGTYLSPTWRGSAELRIPWFRSPRNSATLAAFAQRRSLPGIFVDRSIGFNSVFTREVAPALPFSIGYQFELTRVDAGDLYFCVNFGLCDPPTVAALRATQAMSPLSLSTSLNRTNDPISATSGYYIRGTAEHASSYTLSDYRYNRVLLDAALFTPLSETITLATHFRGGWVKALGSTEAALGVDAEGRSILHPRKRFFAGGSQSVRGFGESQLGPRILTIPPDQLSEAGCSLDSGRAICDEATVNDRLALPDSLFTARALGGNLLAETSVELRFPVLGALSAGVFVDAALVGERGLSDLSQSSVAVTPGFGFRYASMAGPIRVDLGYNPFLTEDLPVVTEVEVDGLRRITNLQIYRTSDTQVVPARRTFTPQRSSGILGFLSQFTLHLSIGHAF